MLIFVLGFEDRDLLLERLDAVLEEEVFLVLEVLVFFERAGRVLEVGDGALVA